MQNFNNNYITIPIHCRENVFKPNIQDRFSLLRYTHTLFFNILSVYVTPRVGAALHSEDIVYCIRDERFSIFEDI